MRKVQTLTTPLTLMFHGIDPGDGRYADAPAGVMGYALERADFLGRLDAIARSGLSVVSPEELLRAPEGEALGAHQVALTFDDGDLSDYDMVLPALDERQWKAAFFLTTERMGGAGSVDWGQAKELAEAGMLLGSHGHTHRFLPSLGPEELRRELSESRDLIEKNTGAEVLTLSFPGGRFDRRVLRAAFDCGYRAAFTSAPVRPSLREGVRVLGRVAVRRGDDLGDLLSQPEKRLRALRRSYALRRAVQACLGGRLYDRLHEALWKRRGK